MLQASTPSTINLNSELFSTSPTLPMWRRPGPPPSGSVNDRRMSSAASARRGVSLSSFGPFPSSQVRPAPTRNISSGRSGVRSRASAPASSTVREHKYLVIIHPEPVSSTLTSRIVIYIFVASSHMGSTVLPQVVMHSRYCVHQR